MFIHKHPYPPFIPKKATKLIVGTLPPPRFSTKELYPEDVDFCYGSKHGLLWPILNSIYQLDLEFKNTGQAIEQRKNFLISEKIGICDIIESCERDKIDASDVGMQDIILRNILIYIGENQSVETILFMGGNSKNGPEFLFRKILKSKNIVLKKVAPKIHQFKFQHRTIQTNSLISPSSAANRSVGANLEFKKLKQNNPEFTTFDFRVAKYTLAFRGL